MNELDGLRAALRQMIAVLEDERQALAGLDIDGIVGASGGKHRLCGTLEDSAGVELDEECRSMLEAARRMNEVNRKVRNLVAANVSARLEAFAGSPTLYRAGAAYTHAGCRA